MGILFALMSATSFSISNILIRKGSQRSEGKENGFFLTIIINVVVLGTIFFISQLIHGFAFSFTWTGFIFFIIAGMLTSGIGRISLFSSIHKIGAVRAPAIKNGAPIFSVSFALLFLGESINLTSFVGMVLLLSAILLQAILLIRTFKVKSLSEVATTLEETEKYRNQWIGYCLALFAAVSFGLGQGFRKQGLLFLENAFFGSLVGALTSLTFFSIYLCFRGQFITTVVRNFSVLNPYFIGAGLVTSLGPLFFFLGASHMQVAYVSVIAGVEPLLTTLLSTFFLKGQENLSLSVWFSVILVFFGTLMIAIA